MQTPANLTNEDKRDRALMLIMAEERGAMTADQLEAAGISRESQARNAAWVAEQVKLRGMQVAA